MPAPKMSSQLESTSAIVSRQGRVWPHIAHMCYIARRVYAKRLDINRSSLR